MAYKSSPAKLSSVLRKIYNLTKDQIDKIKDGPGVPPPSKRTKKVKPKRVTKKRSVAQMKASPAKAGKAKASPTKIARALPSGVARKIVKAVKKKKAAKKKK